MAIQIPMERVGYSLRPIDQLGEEEMLEIGSGQVMVSITKMRSLPFHRFYFGVLNSMAKSGAGTREALHNATKIKTGLVAMCALPNGEFMAFPDSIAFSAMDQFAFNSWFLKAVDFWKASGLWSWIAPDLRAKIEDGERRDAA